MFDEWRGFSQKKLSGDWKDRLAEMARQARGHILKMTTVAGSGHPGGSMSSIEIYLTLYSFAKVDPTDPFRDDRDRIIISHGHTSPGAYAGLAAAGFFDISRCLHGFRQGGSPFEGHVERTVPGIEWDTGNLGQGLSVAIGKAIYARLSDEDFHTYVFMGDGEQQKGQIAEGRRTTRKFGLNDVTVIVDNNGLQISGKTGDIMPVNLKAEWESAGWKVLEIDAHDLDAVYGALHTATHDRDNNYCIIANSVMGKGVSFMENKEAFHGAAVPMDKIGEALDELGIENDVEDLVAKRKAGPPPRFDLRHRPAFPAVQAGAPTVYDVDTRTDNRSAFGKALLGIADANMQDDRFKMAVFDCDLAGSVKTAAFGEKYRREFYQCGVAEHNTATIAGSLSAEHAVAVWADFAMFGIAEPYNQNRLSDINQSNLKLFCTHAGVNVGEDGKTHHCIDYFALLNSTFGWKVITPADPNQTDKIVRYVLTRPGNYAVVMGRTKIPVIAAESGEPYFGEKYTYRYGRMEVIREGQDLALVASGNMLFAAMEAWEMLNEEGRRVQLVSVSDWSDLHIDDLKMLAGFRDVLVIEDHNTKTGLGTTIASQMMEDGLSTRLTKMGVNRYGSSGKADELYKLLEIDPSALAARVKTLLKSASIKV